METINQHEENPIRSIANSQDRTILSLDELVAEIDIETALPFDFAATNEDIAPKYDEIQTSLQNQYILLALEKTRFALPLSSAQEIGRRPDITSLPNLPNWVLGISNIRGEIVSFVNLKAFLGISSSGTKLERRFLIIQKQDMKVGIIVDRIIGIISLSQIDADLQSSPYRDGEIAKYISGVAISGENLTNILDIDKLLSCPRMTAFKQN